MTQVMHDLFTAKPDILFMVAGLVLIAIGVVGSIKSYIDPGKFGRIAALGIGVVLLAVGFTLFLREPTEAAQPEKPVASSSICTFDSGPQAGQTVQLPETNLAPVGSPCQDTAGDKGTIVAPDTPVGTGSRRAAAAEQAHRRDQPAEAESAGQSEPNGLSRICTFNSGPLAGKTRELPRAKPHAVGSACHDLKGDSGVIVPANTPVTP